MDKSAKIYVAGHHGLVGSAIWNNLKVRGYNNLVGRPHKELDLLDPIAVKKFFDEGQKYDFDFDHQFIETGKYDAKPTYKKFTGYSPSYSRFRLPYTTSC